MKVFRALALAALVLCAPLSAQIVIDNVDAGFSVTLGSWNTGSSASGRYGSDYLYKGCVGATSNPTGSVEWRPTLSAGMHEVQVWYSSGSNRANDAPYTVHDSTGSTTIRINQQSGGGQWVSLGSFDFAAGSSGYVELSTDAQTGQVVIADAVRFIPAGTLIYGPDEFRGVWVSRYEWPSTTPATWKSNLDSVMANAKSGNYNAVVVQMRGDTTTLYPSPNEPLSSLIALGTGDDPLQYAINAAHAQGLQMHCYFNTHVCTSSFASTHQSWLIADATGNPISAPVDGYYWLAPGNPEVEAYLREQIMYIVNNYPQLDGIHFDRIRCPEQVYSHDATSEARRTGGANPDSLNFDDWTADQFTRFLRNVYAQVHSVNPTLQISAAPLGLYDASAYSGYSTGYYYGLPRHQDAKAWLAAGAVDWIAPQCYWPDGGSKPDFSDLVPDWLAASNGRHIYPGMSSSSDSDATETINEITAARNFGAPGNQTWSYGSANSLNFWSALTAAGAPYEQPANAPDLPWLSNPTTGIVYGTIKDFGTGQPITDAKITVNGQSYTALSAKDGFWCRLNLTPGSYTITVDAGATGTAVVQVNNLAAGEVRQLDIAVAAAGVPTRLEFATTPPTGVNVNDQFGFTIKVVDSQGAMVTSGSHNLGVTAIGATGTLTGPTTAATAGGTATFSFSYDNTGSVAFVVADSGGLTPATATINFSDKDAGAGEDSGCAVNASTGWTLWLLLALLPAVWLVRRRAP